MQSQLELDPKRKALVEMIKKEWGPEGEIENMTWNPYGSEIYDIEKRYRQGKNYTEAGSKLYNALKSRRDDLTERYEDSQANTRMSVAELEKLRSDLFALKLDMLRHANSMKPSGKELFDKNTQEIAQIGQVKTEPEKTQTQQANKATADIIDDASKTLLNVEAKRNALIDIIVKEWGSEGEICRMTRDPYGSEIYHIEKRYRQGKNYTQEGSRLYNEVKDTCAKMQDRFKEFERNPQLSIGVLHKLRNDLFDLYMRMKRLAGHMHMPGFSDVVSHAEATFQKNNDEFANLGKPKPPVDERQEKIKALTKQADGELRFLGAPYPSCNGNREKVKTQFEEDKKYYAEIKKKKPASMGEFYYYDVVRDYERKFPIVERYLKLLDELEQLKAEVDVSSTPPVSGPK